MINTNFDILTSSFESKQNEIKVKNDAFINTINSIKNSTNLSLTYETIKSLTLEEIENSYENEDDKALAKNLKLATMFSKDEILSKTLFSSVSNMSSSLGYDYLSSKYSDKSNFFKSQSDKNSLGDLLFKSISYNINGNKNEITKDDLDEILLEVNSFNFLSALSSNYKKGSDKYKNDENRYSFLYNNYAQEYDDIMKKYKDLESYQKSIIKQF
ncbi:hypothetical protein [Arcobacter vandammei]|uniref:hypothetical protein n=1 Tax=Arcobacter vandammei TaxID=2782243 RepID=UPI0018DFC936|nr:hypothetical protein [Arcobacter vandammei]